MGDRCKKVVLEEWFERKLQLHEQERTPPFKEGEIWWCGIGENVGIEINGKSSLASRPVLVFKKFGRYGFFGIPLSSQAHEGTWYAHFRFQGKNQVACLVQSRSFSAYRLYTKIGTADKSNMRKIRVGFKKLFLEDE